MNTENTSTIPNYIQQFINFNHNKLIEIYEDGMNREKEGFLYFDCNREENRVDVLFLSPENITKIISNKLWDELKNKYTNKKLFFIRENQSVFLLNL